MEAVLTSTTTYVFEQKYEKYKSFFYLIFFQFLEVKFSIYLNRCVFVMDCAATKTGLSLFGQICECSFADGTGQMILWYWLYLEMPLFKYDFFFHYFRVSVYKSFSTSVFNGYAIYCATYGELCYKHRE